jgi:hypothetical protein
VRLPDHAPRTSQSFSGQIPVRFDGAPGGPLEGDTKWRGVRSFEHADLCRAFNLDPARFFFDLPSSVRGIGSNASGIAGAQRAGRRRISGFVMMAGLDTPVAKLTVCFDGEKFADWDPMSPADFFNLERS